MSDLVDPRRSASDSWSSRPRTTRESGFIEYPNKQQRSCAKSRPKDGGFFRSQMSGLLASSRSYSLMRTVTTMNRLPSRTFVKYLLMQIPGWLLLLVIVLLLRSGVELSAWAAGGLLALMVLKDLLLYPFRRRAYEEDPRTGAERLVGERGVVARRLAPNGYIRVRGELWRAELRPLVSPVAEGNTVQITAGRGLTLTVEETESITDRAIQY
jgi:membrane protein implicated in regulation of membrane protease activity